METVGPWVAGGKFDLFVEKFGVACGSTNSTWIGLHERAIF